MFDRNRSLIIYVSGDKGSVELRRLCQVKGVRYEARDIRHGKDHIGFLIKSGLDTVPQVFDKGTGAHIGGFSEIADEIRALPDRKPAGGTAA